MTATFFDSAIETYPKCACRRIFMRMSQSDMAKGMYGRSSWRTLLRGWLVLTDSPIRFPLTSLDSLTPVALCTESYFWLSCLWICPAAVFGTCSSHSNVCLPAATANDCLPSTLWVHCRALRTRAMRRCAKNRIWYTFIVTHTRRSVHTTFNVQTFCRNFPARARPFHTDIDGRDMTNGVRWTSQPLPELHQAQQRSGDHNEDATRTITRKKTSTKYAVQEDDDLSESTVSSDDRDDTEKSRDPFPQVHEDFNKFKVVTAAATSCSTNGNKTEPLDTTPTVPAGLVRRERRQRGPAGNRRPGQDRLKSGSDTTALSGTGRTHDNRGFLSSSKGTRRTTSAPSRQVGQSTTADAVMTSTNGLRPHRPHTGEHCGGSEADRLQHAPRNRNGTNSKRHLTSGISIANAVRAGKKHEQFHRGDGARAKLSTSGIRNKAQSRGGRRCRAGDGMSGRLDGGMESDIDVSSCGDMTISSDEEADDMAYAG